MAVVLQLIVISYNHFSGYHHLNGFNELVFRVIRGIIYSMIAGFAIAYPDLLVINYLNKKLQWQQGALKRALVQFAFMIIIAVVVSSLMTSFAHWLNPYRQGFQNVLVNNMLIYSVVNAFFMSILEAWIYLDESTKEKIRAEQLHQQLIAEAATRAKFEAQMLIEEEKNKYARKLIEQEKKLNKSLELEIHKRVLLSEQLNESREQLNSILANLAGAAYRCYFDEHYSMKYISEKIFDISGYHAAEFIVNTQQTYAAVIHPDDRDFCRQSIKEAILQKNQYEFEYRIVHHSGKIVWVSENGKGIFNESNQLVYLDGIIVDVTRRKEAEFAATESERNYKELMDLLPQPIFELDIEGNILYINGAGKVFFGIEMPENSDEKISALDLMIEEDVPRVKENIRKSNQAILSTPIEYSVKRPDGSTCPVLIYGSPIIRNEKIVGRRGIIIDISDRKKYEKKILQAKEALERVNSTLEQSIAERTRQLTETNTKLLKVQKENLQAQFEVLKQQVNPHFLFNSLNVLSSLIDKDIAKAQLFIDEFSQIYRYVLETIEKTVVTLGKELGFVRSYIFLQQIRYGDNLNFTVNLPSKLLKLYMPPLSLQVVLENAIKHNIVNESHPLHINISHVDAWLIVSNSIQPKISMGNSTGLGQKNMVKRYALISDKEPTFQVINNQYVVKLPLLNVENDERIDH
ncbi:MAG: PAS domain S-box protein [Prolixibacteraceae bacterium]|nr:PAS domain S-box protein [Prolixibacteraceae bacterium]